MTKQISAIQQYMNGLATGVRLPKLQKEKLLATAANLTDYVFDYNKTDLTYSANEYPSSGLYGGLLPPWFNSLETIPADWQWTNTDLAANQKRGDQVAAEQAYIEANVPNQSYSGTAAEQIQQRYTNGIWDGATFRPDYVAILTQNWIADDAEFARQRLGGANPNVIARYSGTAATIDQWVQNAQGAKDKPTLTQQLQSAANTSQLFVCDYQTALGSAVQKQLVRNGQWLTAPLVYFVLSGDKLLPVAIQLTPGAYIFTPADDANSWLLAKLWVANADAQWWFSGTHLYNTHTVVMEFGTAALNLLEQNQLSADHPIFKLLQPHLKKVFNINALVYDADGTGIYQQGSFCDQFLPTGRIGLYDIISSLFSPYNLDDASFPRQLALRGIDLASLPASFPYRDDGQVWWDAIQTFVGEVVDASYASDSAVAQDQQLNGWMNKVATAFNKAGNVSRFTWQANKAYLKQLATNLFFIGSVQHTAVNNSMLPGLGFLPNAPFAMTAQPPTGPGVTDAQLLASLPDPKSTTGGAVAWPIQNQIAFVMNGTSDVSDLAAGDGTEASLQATYGYTAGSAQATAVHNFYVSLWNAGATSVQMHIRFLQQLRIDTYKKANPQATTVPNSVSYYYLTVSATAAQSALLNSAVMNCIQI